MTVLCNAYEYEVGTTCLRPNAVYAEALCVHEHMQTGLLCQKHMRQAMAEEIRCPDCRDAGHECPTRLLSKVSS